MTIEQDVAALTTATTALLGAVNVGKAVLDAKVLTATEQAANAQANATQVATTATDVSTQASAAAASALSAATSRDLAIAAWGASTAPAETLAAISQSIHVGTVVKSIIYDTSKDSDGGAWRKRCTDKSWFTEALGGTAWLATKCPDEATARAVIQSAKSPELFSQTAFNAGVGLAVGSGWAVSAGTATLNGGAGLLTDAANFASYVAGKTYVVIITVTSKTSGGTFQAYLRGNLVGSFAAVGTYAFSVVAGTSTTEGLSLLGIASCVGSVAFASVKEVNTTISAAGYVYQSTAAGSKYFSLTGTSGQTEVFRGITREFPEQVAIVAEANRVVIYDLTVPGCPMWMVFMCGPSGTGMWNDVNFVATSLASCNSAVLLGTSNGTYGGLFEFNFVKDHRNLSRINQGAAYIGIIPRLSRRNSEHFGSFFRAGGVNLVDERINDIAVTVLDGSEVDPQTLLPRPTIAVATAGGVSVIRSDGTVVNSDSLNLTGVIFDPQGFLMTRGVATTVIKKITAIPSANFTLVNTYFNTSIPAVLSVAPNCFEKSKIGVLAVGGPLGLNLLKENPTTPAKGMVAYITNAYSSGYQVGDSRGAWLADTVAETIAGTELVVNGGFDADTTGWIPTNATLAMVGGELQLTSLAAGGCSAIFTLLGLTVGKQYQLTRTIRRGTASLSAQSDVGGMPLTNTANTTTSNITSTHAFTATSTGHTITLYFVAGAAGETAFGDNYSVKPLDADRSVKNNGLSIVGSLVKTPVAAGAQLVAYSGFSAANYLERPYSADFDVGTGDFYILGWSFPASGANAAPIFSRSQIPVGGASLGFELANGNGVPQLLLYCGAGAFSLLSSPVAGISNAWNFVEVLRRSGTLIARVNGVQVHAGANVVNLTNTTAVTRIGSYQTGGSSTGSLALVRFSATAPSDDQCAQIYRDELALFQPGAQCTIAGTSTAVTALAYDESTDLLHVGTSWGRSAFKGLLRTESEATTTGAITSLSAAQGAVLTGGTSAKIYQPALQLRDELARKEEARRALGKVPQFFEYDALAAQTAFVLPVGYTAKAVYSAEALKREGSTKAYTRSFDGYRETITFAVAPGAAVWVSIMCIRSN